ncbi:MAG: hypothetical protein ACYDHO_00195 [Gaiellaceae bacterium]
MSVDRLQVFCAAMRHFARVSCIVAIAVLAATSASGAEKASTVKLANGPFQTGIWFHDLGSTEANQTEAERMRAAGSKISRVYLYWSRVAPLGSAPPAGFQPRDPADPNYRWQVIDEQIKTLAAAGLQPMVQLLGAPEWASGSSSAYEAGTYKPSPTAFASFLGAAAERYSGNFQDLPRVRYWEVWNEPNLDSYLSPQMEKGKAFAVNWYRSMLNKAADSIHAVHADNVVVAGDTSPFGRADAKKGAMSPLFFMEKVLCVKEKKRGSAYTYKPSCKTKTKFDVWAVHPYSQGGPTYRSGNRGNISLGNVDDVRLVLNTALKANHVVSKTKVRLWATEFSWDSRPPDSKGVPAALEARWVSEVPYRLWANGVSMLVWLELRDLPMASSYYQSGLYYADANGIAGDRAKPALRSFRFPFVALPQTVKGKSTVFVWGRTPTSKAASVYIERSAGKKWKRVKTVKANGSGIFKLLLPAQPIKASMRARLADGSDVSTAFALKEPKKGWKGCAFGTC